MSKRGYISRYLLILKKLKSKKYSSFEEIQEYIEQQVDFLQMQDDSLMVGFSKRTFQRDLKEIRTNFGIDIEFSRSMKGYFIVQNELENMNFQRMLEAFDMFNSLNLAQDLKPYVHIENQKPHGTEHLYGLLHAIKNHFQIEFSHKKFWEDQTKTRKVEPYALKEFKNRWYLVAKDSADNSIKTFGLDRLTELNITRTKFIYPDNFDAREKFRFFFGIISPNELLPEEIILSFDSDQGKFIKSLPLHLTQEIIKEDEAEFIIRLKICVTHDFIMEILSFGDSVKVIQPSSLKASIIEIYKNAISHYND
jgi:predicted DNA-binding transcriptional regulator YafY